MPVGIADATDGRDQITGTAADELISGVPKGMGWWGNPTFADALAGQLTNGLSPAYITGDQVEGPLFSTSFDGTSSGAEVHASYVDLSTLGITDVVASASFDRTASFTDAVTKSHTSVPAPLAFLGLAGGFAASRRLRRRVRHDHKH